MWKILIEFFDDRVSTKTRPYQQNELSILNWLSAFNKLISSVPMMRTIALPIFSFYSSFICLFVFSSCIFSAIWRSIIDLYVNLLEYFRVVKTFATMNSEHELRLAQKKKTCGGISWSCRILNGNHCHSWAFIKWFHTNCWPLNNWVYPKWRVLRMRANVIDLCVNTSFWKKSAHL